MRASFVPHLILTGLSLNLNQILAILPASVSFCEFQFGITARRNASRFHLQQSSAAGETLLLVLSRLFHGMAVTMVKSHPRIEYADGHPVMSRQRLNFWLSFLPLQSINGIKAAHHGRAWI
jgi:hypothetical protein